MRTTILIPRSKPRLQTSEVFDGKMYGENMKPKIILIAAVAKNNVIGSKNDLPWYLPEDLKRFKMLTTGKTVLMGRKSYESILKRLGKPLPNRVNIVITRQGGFHVPEDVQVFHNIDSAFKSLQDLEEIFVIGGGEIFNQTFDQADKLHITHVHKDVDGDVFFPEIKDRVWKKIREEINDGYTFADYERI